ncbi:Tn3 family transposase [Actinomadura coerulea]|uniref:Tn3 family transposase n=1 Tax=Actinomadura coerulea TaxID=46159 RepID=UPI0034233533
MATKEDWPSGECPELNCPGQLVEEDVKTIGMNGEMTWSRSALARHLAGGGVNTGQVRAHDVMRMLQRDGDPTQLGEAIAHYGRLCKTLHVLTYAVEEPYRRDRKGIRNLQESRHALAGKLFHGRKGEICQHHKKGMGAHLSALGLVLNCVT